MPLNQTTAHGLLTTMSGSAAREAHTLWAAYDCDKDAIWSLDFRLVADLSKKLLQFSPFRLNW